mgnify:CR=1 FL=1
MIILETVRMYTKHVLNGEQEFTGKKTYLREQILVGSFFVRNDGVVLEPLQNGVNVAA